MAKLDVPVRGPSTISVSRQNKAASVTMSLARQPKNATGMMSVEGRSVDFSQTGTEPVRADQQCRCPADTRWMFRHRATAFSRQCSCTFRGGAPIKEPTSACPQNRAGFCATGTAGACKTINHFHRHSHGRPVLRTPRHGLIEQSTHRRGRRCRFFSTAATGPRENRGGLRIFVAPDSPNCSSSCPHGMTMR